MHFARVLTYGAICLSLTVHLSGQAQDRLASSAQAQSLTLSQALEAAWQRSLAATESGARQSRVEADLAVAQKWLAGPPALSLGQREGRAGAPPASRETEVGLALPLWRPGQRAAGDHAAQSQSGWAQAMEKTERLRLAGQLRETLGALQLAEVDLRLAERQANTLGQLEEDVQRRVKAGDLAPADALAARSEWLAANAQVGLARQALQTQQAHWRLLTGMPALAMQETAPPAMTQLPETHPELVLAAAAVDLGQRRVEQSLVQRTDTPELMLSTRQERPGVGAAPQNSVALALRIPVGGQVYQQPRIAAAQGELDSAQKLAQRTRERLTAELVLAQSQLSLSQKQQQAEQERATLLSERARLIDKSFRAGETALPELLRALAAAASAESAFARQQAIHQTAISRLQQALGLLP